MKIWEPKPPGKLWAAPGLLRDCFTVTFIINTFLLTLRLLMSYIYIYIYIYIYEISSLRVNMIKWQVKFNPVA